MISIVKFQKSAGGFFLARRRSAARFWRDDSGAMWQFAITILFIMITASGVAINLMRFETERARTQSVADSAVLAAASFGQTRDAKQVVEDYFDKAGLGDRLVRDQIQVVSGINGKIVTVNTEVQTGAFFANFLGYEALRGTGSARAEEYRGDVEVVMVLDISGSMNSYNRIQNLKIAASDFVTQLIDSDTENRISIAIVPYNGQVNLGANLFNEINSRFGIADNTNVTRRSLGPTTNDTPSTTNDARCVDMPTSQLIKPAFDANPGLARTPYTDHWSNVTTSNAHQNPVAHNTANIWCPARAANAIRLPTNNKANLLAYINALEAVGATSIDLGLKWGAWLIDPQAQPTLANLVNNTSQVSSYFSDRPRPYNDPHVLKFVVLMTDGEHFIDTRVKSEYRTGNPPGAEIRRIWENGVWRYSIRHDSRGGSNKFWVPHLSAWRSGWYGGNNAQNVPMQQLWADHRLQWGAWQLWGRALGMSYNNSVAMFREQTPTTNMDARLLELCNTLKGRNVILFGVAFEAPPLGQALLQQCASSDRYFGVSGTELLNAFRQIRGQITTLRLTQ